MLKWMKINYKTWLLVSLLMFIHINCYSKVKLPSIIGSNMVLQQKTEAKLWG